MVNNEQKIEHTSKCHEVCYLKGVQQETINDEKMLECEVIDPDTGKIYTQILEKIILIENFLTHIDYS
jgi:uncharacterized protein YqkB